MAGFTFSDAGPHNLGYLEDEDRAVFIDFEHSEIGKTKRKIWNQSFTSLVAEVASCMAISPAWGVIGMPLVRIARDSWWLNISDDQMFSDSNLWLYNGLSKLESMVVKLLGSHGNVYGEALMAAPELPTAPAAAPMLPTPAASEPVARTDVPRAKYSAKGLTHRIEPIAVVQSPSPSNQSSSGQTCGAMSSRPANKTKRAQKKVGFSYEPDERSDSCPRAVRATAVRIEPTPRKASASTSVASSSNYVAPLSEAERDARGTTFLPAVAASSNHVAPPKTNSGNLARYNIRRKEAERVQNLQTIRRLYETFNPGKLSEWTRLAAKYQGSEGNWLKGLKNKYFELSLWKGPLFVGRAMAVVENVRAHIDLNHGQRFRGKRFVDGSTGSNAKRRRMDYDTRVSLGESGEHWKYKPTAERSSGDAIAPLQIAWHTAIKPVAIARTCGNPKEGGQPLRSIMDTDRFVQDNMKFVTKLFRTIAGPTVPEADWFNICYVRQVIDAMLAEACKAQHGRWQWWEFHLTDEEKKELSLFILKAYIAGSEVGKCSVGQTTHDMGAWRWQ